MCRTWLASPGCTLSTTGNRVHDHAVPAQFRTRVRSRSSQETTHRGRGEPARHHGGVVRLLPLRDGRQPGVQPAVLPRPEFVRRHDAGLRDLRGGLRGPPHRRCRLRPHRRPDRTQEDPRPDDVHHGRRHRADGRPAHPRARGCGRTDPAAPAAHPAGLRARRRMGRGRAARRRAQSGEEAWSVRQYPSGGPRARSRVGHRGVRSVAGGLRRAAVPVVRLADRVPAQPRPRRRRFRRAPEGRRDPGLPRGAGTREEVVRAARGRLPARRAPQHRSRSVVAVG